MSQLSFDPATVQRVRDNDVSLTSLSMRIRTDDEIAMLAQALSHNTVLETLNFRYSSLSGDRVRKLVSRMSPSIHTVTLCNCQIERQGALDLALMAEGGTIANLDLRHNAIGDEGAHMLSIAMTRTNCSWRTLVLGNCMISDDGARSLAEGLQHHPLLRDLNLRGNEIGDTGMVALAHAMTFKKEGGHDEGLVTLDLRENHITDGGAESMAMALANHKNPCTLTELNLSCNRIGGYGAIRLANALTVNSTLQRLFLSGNAIGDRGAGAFLMAMDYNTTLVHLDLSHNGASKGIRNDMAQILEGNRNTTRTKKSRVEPEPSSDCASSLCVAVLFDENERLNSHNLSLEEEEDVRLFLATESQRSSHDQLSNTWLHTLTCGATS